MIHRTILLLGLALLAPAPATPAQEPKTQKPTAPAQGRLEQAELDERLFLVYALEDLYRDTRSAKKDQLFVTSAEIRGFRANQRHLVDQLLQHIVKRKLEAELLDLYDAYRKLLDLTKDLEVKVADREAKYMERILELRADFVKGESERRERATAEVIDTAAEAGARAGGRLFADAGDVFAGALFGGLARSVTVQMRLKNESEKAFQKAVQLAEEYERKNKPLKEQDVRRYNAEFFAAFNRERDANLAGAPDSIAVLAARHNWGVKEVEFDPTRATADWRRAERPRDPFRVKQVILETPAPDDRRGAELCLANAKEALEARKLVPKYFAKTTAEVYRHYHATFAGLAGNQANAASVEQLGATGFSGAKKARPAAANTAVEAWKQYRTFEDPARDHRGYVLHKVFLADAHAGQLPKAYFAVVSHKGTLGNEDPVFWYDAARVCALSNDPARGYFCLSRAVALGFKGKAEAAVTPDLEPLRTGDRQKFDDALAGKPMPLPRR